MVTSTGLSCTITQMFESDQYELVDFGNGRKLERFGGIEVERPSPAAVGPPVMESWQPEARYIRRGSGGRWASDTTLPNNWQTDFETLRFELAATPSGQVGLFPEQASNWAWLKKKLVPYKACRVLNLFAYTGGSTLAAAAAGASVTHVDSAKSVVSWARRNAEASGLADAPIRWIVEDAPKFVEREIRRGSQYDGIILDPPSYGHGPKNEEWKLQRDLLDLLTGCRQLLNSAPRLFLLSCHTPGFGEVELSAAVSTCLFGSCGAGVRTRQLQLLTANGRSLPAGCTAYWP